MSRCTDSSWHVVIIICIYTRNSMLLFRPHWVLSLILCLIHCIFIFVFGNSGFPWSFLHSNVIYTEKFMYYIFAAPLFLFNAHESDGLLQFFLGFVGQAGETHKCYSWLQYEVLSFLCWIELYEICVLFSNICRILCDCVKGGMKPMCSFGLDPFAMSQELNLAMNCPNGRE